MRRFPLPARSVKLTLRSQARREQMRRAGTSSVTLVSLDERSARLSVSITALRPPLSRPEPRRAGRCRAPRSRRRGRRSPFRKNAPGRPMFDSAGGPLVGLHAPRAGPLPPRFRRRRPGRICVDAAACRCGTRSSTCRAECVPIAALPRRSAVTPGKPSIAPRRRSAGCVGRAPALPARLRVNAPGRHGRDGDLVRRSVPRQRPARAAG